MPAPAEAASGYVCRTSMTPSRLSTAYRGATWPALHPLATDVVVPDGNGCGARQWLLTWAFRQTARNRHCLGTGAARVVSGEAHQDGGDFRAVPQRARCLVPEQRNALRDHRGVTSRTLANEAGRNTSRYCYCLLRLQIVQGGAGKIGPHEVIERICRHIGRLKRRDGNGFVPVNVFGLPCRAGPRSDRLSA